jgi:hypothetical protein
VTTFEFQPVVFSLPERAGGTNDIFVVASGIVSLDRHYYEQNGLLRTVSFASRVGYFRQKGEYVQHVYGAHYDFSKDELGHPIFHAQLRSLAEFASAIGQYSGGEVTLEDGGDYMKGVLKTVRVPSAQMDVFSLFLQIIADHLLWRNSSDADKSAFSDLLTKNRLIQGAAAQVQRLQVPPANKCYRSVHWYTPTTN